jgi:hypothetical protein
MPTTGDMLLELAARAQQEVLLVAPFVKHGALRRVLHVVPDHVQVRCVTRWDPAEIAVGVSDLEVWDIVRQRPRTDLRLRMNLHAKLYRSDQRCLVGSANLTGTALGWTHPANLELLTEVAANTPPVGELEAELARSSYLATEAMHESMLRAVESLRALGVTGKTLSPAVAETATTSLDAWLPTCRSPDRLYSAYRGREDRMISSAFADAQRDLSVLKPPASLDRKSFTAYVSAVLEQHPVIRQLDDFVATPRSTEEIQDFLTNRGVIPNGTTSAEAWDALKMWLLVFFPNRYRAKPPQGTELFVKGSLLS